MSLLRGEVERVNRNLPVLGIKDVKELMDASGTKTSSTRYLADG